MHPSVQHCRNRLTPFAIAIHLAIASMAGGGLVVAAHAQTTTVQINVPAGPLAETLSRFAQQAGVAISIDTNLLQGRQSQGLEGNFSVDEFNRLLQNTEYTVGRTPVGFVLVAKPVSSSTRGEDAVLPAVTVRTAATTELLPQQYAGGQMARGGRLGILGNRDMMDTPFIQSNYTAELVTNTQARLVSEVLDNDPTAQSTNSTNGHDSINIRGFHIGNGFVLFNGMHGIISGTLGSIAAESFERIEVLKGPNALLTGNIGKVGGAVNLVPKRAGNKPLTQFTADYSSDSQIGGHLDVGRRFGENQQFGVRFNGVVRDGDTAVDRQTRKTALASVGLDYQGEHSRLEADFGYQKMEVQGIRRFTRMATGVQVPVAPNNRSNWFNPAEFVDSEVTYAAVRGEYELGNRITAFGAVGTSQADLLRLAANRSIINVNGDLAAGSLGDTVAIRSDSKTFEGGLRAAFETGSIKHQAVLAYTYASTLEKRTGATGNPATSFPSSNIYNPTIGAMPTAPMPSFGDISPRVEDVATSVSLVDTLSTMDDKVQVTLGGRMQQVKATNFNLATGAVTSRYNESAFTPMAGLVVKPWQGVSLYANYIEGLQKGPVAPLAADNAGEVFAPYATKQYEIGAKRDLGALSYSVALYQIAQPNAYTNSSTRLFGIDGEQRHRGVDFNVFGEASKGLRVLGGIAFIDSVLTKTENSANDGNSGIGVPKWRAVLGGEWDVPNASGFTLTGRVIRNGATYLDVANTQKIPHWVRVDLGARYKVSDTVTIRAMIENAFDKNYWTTSGESELLLSAPRTIRIAATFSF